MSHLAIMTKIVGIQVNSDIGTVTKIATPLILRIIITCGSYDYVICVFVLPLFSIGLTNRDVIDNIQSNLKFKVGRY